MIVLVDLDFEWNNETANKVVKMWNDGMPFYDIYKTTKRRKEEVFLLLLDLSMAGKIEKRNGYLNGNWIKEV